MAGIKIKGTQAVIRMLKGATKEIQREVDAEIFATLHDIRNRAISAAPVDTGFLVNSIHVIEAEGIVRAEAYYAPYIEFGTGTAVRIPSYDGLDEYAAQFKSPTGNDRVNLPARPFLIPAWIDESLKLIRRLQNDSR